MISICLAVQASRMSKLNGTKERSEAAKQSKNCVLQSHLNSRKGYGQFHGPEHQPWRNSSLDRIDNNFPHLQESLGNQNLSSYVSEQGFRTNLHMPPTHSPDSKLLTKTVCDRRML
jgi:hypothetical protein